MTEKPAPKRSNIKRLLIVLPILLLAAIIVNWQAICAVARGERTLKGVIYGIVRSPDYDLQDWDVPDPIGAEDAKVLIEVFLHGGEACHVDSLFMGQALGTIDPERIRVLFQDTATEQGHERFTELRIGCEQGLAVNGKTKFTVPVADRESKRKEKTLYMTYDAGWSNADLRVILDRELKQAYDGEGLAMSAEQLSAHMGSEFKRFAEQAIEEAKAKQKDKG